MSHSPLGSLSPMLRGVVVSPSSRRALGSSPSLLDERSHSLTSQPSLGSAATAANSSNPPTPSCACLDRALAAICCCWCRCRCRRDILGSRHAPSLATSFAFVPLGRKLFGLAVALLQLAALQFIVVRQQSSADDDPDFDASADMRLGIVILACFGGVLLPSLAWAARSRGFHLGLGLCTLLVWIPLDIYLIMRLAGLDQDDFDNSSLTSETRTYVYVVLEVVALGLACLLAFGDVIRWLRGRRKVFGHHVIFPRAAARPTRARNTPGFEPSPQVYSSLSSPYAIVGRSGEIDSLSASATPDIESALGETPIDWTPRTRTEHLLNRAQEAMQEQQQLARHAETRRQQHQAPIPRRERAPSFALPPTAWTSNS